MRAIYCHIIYIMLNRKKSTENQIGVTISTRPGTGALYVNSFGTPIFAQELNKRTQIEKMHHA